MVPVRIGQTRHVGRWREGGEVLRRKEGRTVCSKQFSKQDITACEVRFPGVLVGFPTLLLLTQQVQRKYMNNHMHSAPQLERGTENRQAPLETE